MRPRLYAGVPWQTHLAQKGDPGRTNIWTDWKRPERKRKNLLRLGVDPSHAYAWIRTRKGGLRVAQSPIMITTITLERLYQRGYEAMLDYYLKVSPHLNEPLYTRPVLPAPD